MVQKNELKDKVQVLTNLWLLDFCWCLIKLGTNRNGEVRLLRSVCGIFRSHKAGRFVAAVSSISPCLFCLRCNIYKHIIQNFHFILVYVKFYYWEQTCWSVKQLHCSNSTSLECVVEASCWRPWMNSIITLLPMGACCMWEGHFYFNFFCCFVVVFYVNIHRK